MNLVSHINLLRHGKTSGGSRFFGATDIPISQYGMTQMWTTLQNSLVKWDHIISSPLTRCADFAHQLAQRDSIAITLDERLKEFNFGIWEGYTAAEIMQIDADALTKFWETPSAHPPQDGEYLHHFQTRVLAAWYEITSTYIGQKVLLVTHSGVIRTILCHILQKPIDRLLEIEVKHASMQHIQVTQKQGLPHATLISNP